jgi:hypothetical protein
MIDEKTYELDWKGQFSLEFENRGNRMILEKVRWQK